jgi:hypothetical protein
MNNGACFGLEKEEMKTKKLQKKMLQQNQH